MKTLSETWKQKKHLNNYSNKNVCSSTPNASVTTNNKVKLEVSVKDVSPISEFGNTQLFNDEEFLRNVEDLERTHEKSKKIVLMGSNYVSKVKATNVRRSSRLNSQKVSPTSSSYSNTMPKRAKRIEIETSMDWVTEIPSSSGSAPQSLLLSDWNLPQSVLDRYHESGIRSMFEWQVSCIGTEGVLDGKNLVYSAPTSAGKTLVAEILVLKCVLERKKKAIFVLPFVSVAQEKMTYLKTMFRDAGVRVDGFMGNHSPLGGFAKLDVAVCTIEKANSLVNRLLEEGSLDQLGIVVIDELHMLGDPHRGYLLELLLTKIKYVQSKRSLINVDVQSGSVRSDDTLIQIVGMSATLPNLDLLARWLDARLFTTGFRPVPLTETVKVGLEIRNVESMMVTRTLDPSPLKNDPDHVVQLCLETVADGNGILVFCPTKAWCEKLAETIAKEVYELGRDQRDEATTEFRGLIHLRDGLRSSLDGDKLSEILNHLARSSAGLDKVLAKTVSFGVAFHHAGLTFDEREIIEGAFRQGAVKVLTATSTLSSGVNLPARRVIVRTPMFYGQTLDVLTYNQMIGRAGRKGLDDTGESILICKQNEYGRALKLVKAQLKPVSSCLEALNCGTLSSSMKRAILEVVVSGAANNPSEVELFASCTLLSCSEVSARRKESNVVQNYIEYLVQNEFVRLQTVDEIDGVGYVGTPLGKAVLSSALSPDEGLVVYRELERARRCFVLENELHVVYQVTPIYLTEQWSNLDWSYFKDIYESLSPDMKRVADCVGVDERYLLSASRGRIGNKQLAVHLRFYTALALHDLVNEVSLSSVARKFGCNRGMLQTLQQSAATFAGMVTVFCHQLGWFNLELLLAQFQSRLHFGVQQELCDLLRLTCLTAKRARVLFNAGYKTVALLAVTNPSAIETVLRNAGPFQSDKQKDNENEYEMQNRLKQRKVWIPGRNGITEVEAAALIVNEARDLLQKGLGLADVNWNSNKPSIDRMNNSVVVAAPPLTQPLMTITKTRQQKQLIEYGCSVNNGLRDEVSARNASNNSHSVTRYDKSDDCKEKGSESVLGAQPRKLLDLFPIKNGHVTNSKNFESSDVFMRSNGSNLTGTVNVPLRTESPCVLIRTECPYVPIRTESPYVPIRTESPYVPIRTESPYVLIRPESPYVPIRTESCDVPIRTEGSDLLLRSKGSDVPMITEGSDVLMGTEGPDASIRPRISDAPMRAESTDMSIRPQVFDVPLRTEGPNGPIGADRSDVSISSKTSPFGLTLGASMFLDSLTESLFSDHRIKKSDRPGDSKQHCDLDAESDTNTSDRSTPDLVMENGSWVLASMENASFDVAVDHYTSKTSCEVEKLKVEVAEPQPVVVNGEDIEEFESQVLQTERLIIDSFDDEKKNDFTDDSVFDRSDLSKNGSKNLDVTSNRNDITVRGFSEELFSPDKSPVSKKNTVEVIGDDRDTSGEYIPPTPSPKAELENQKKTRSSLIRSVSDIGSITVVDVMENNRTFTEFLKSWTKEIRFSVAVAAEKRPSVASNTIGIGRNIQKSKSVSSIDLPLPSLEVYGEDVSIYGLAVCWDPKIVHYVSFVKADGTRNDPEAISSILDAISNSFQHFRRTIVAYDVKEQLRALFEICGQLPQKYEIQDPRIAAWLLEQESSEWSFLDHVRDHFADNSDCLVKLGLGSKGSGFGSPGLTVTKAQRSCRTRSTNEAAIILKLMDCLIEKLKSEKLYKVFNDIEMPSIVPLLKMELNGLGFDEQSYVRYQSLFQAKLKELESRSQKIAGRKLNFASPQDVAQVLYIDCKLPTALEMECGGDVESPCRFARSPVSYVASPSRFSKRLRQRLPTSCSTKKDALKKLASSHELPNIILEWRRLHSTLTKIIVPMQKRKLFHSDMKMYRLHGSLMTHTVTGRVVMSDPSLQMVPRDFEIESSTCGDLNSLEKATTDDEVTNLVNVSLRGAYIPFKGGVLIAGDYSQLELRVLAHLSRDESLIRVLNEGVDVFRSIAAQWKGLAVSDVTDVERQQAKQICYGMIYGMGSKALGEALGVEEMQAVTFMTSFKSAYPGIDVFIKNTVEKCRVLGYVKTLMGRRRRLPGITSSNSQLRSQAERQAVNTTIQGSASDIAKRAMIDIDRQMNAVFPETKLPLCDSLWKKRRTEFTDRSGGYFVLQLHDELMYEVVDCESDRVARIVRKGMERAVSLRVKLPVKLRMGRSWGTLKEI